MALTLVTTICLGMAVYSASTGTRHQKRQKTAAIIATIPTSAADSVKAVKEKLAADTASQDTTETSDSTAVKKQTLHRFLDLGLPSGTLWAQTNLEADHPADYGKYYTYNQAKHACENNSATPGNSKYEAPSLPTREQYQELIDNCKWKWIKTKNSHGDIVPGYKITGKNGKILFLPACGVRGDTGYLAQGSVGYYWTKTHDIHTAVELSFYANGYYLEPGNSIMDGQSVRQVMCPKRKKTVQSGTKRPHTALSGVKKPEYDNTPIVPAV